MERFFLVLIVIVLMMCLVVLCREWANWMRVSLSTEYQFVHITRITIIFVCIFLTLAVCDWIDSTLYSVNSGLSLDPFQSWGKISAFFGFGFAVGILVNRMLVPIRNG